MAEEALKRSEEKYRRLFDDDLTGDFIATLNGEILEYNPAFAEIYGIKDSNKVLKLNISHFNPDDWENLIRRLKSEHKIKSYQTIHQRPDGKKIKIIANLVAITNELGQFEQVKGYIFEV
jgi:PAS domain S-box-containing protein